MNPNRDSTPAVLRWIAMQPEPVRVQEIKRRGRFAWTVAAMCVSTAINRGLLAPTGDGRVALTEAGVRFLLDEAKQ